MNWDRKMKNKNKTKKQECDVIGHSILIAALH